MAMQHANPRELVDLRPLGPAIGRTKTAAIVKSSSFEAIRLIVRTGMRIAPHQVPGPITLHCLEGRVLLGLSDGELELSAGQWVYLEGGETHWLEGVEDASLLLTILFAHREDRSSGGPEAPGSNRN